MTTMISASDLRAAARRGEWRGATSGHCPAYQQVNLAILPKEVAAEFAAFCTRNPKPCPIIEITPPGDPEPARSAPGADLRTDVPGYRIYRKGELAEQRSDIQDVWRDDLVAFLLGCSLTFEHALVEAGLPPRNVELDTKGDPTSIGIADLNRPDYGEPVPIYPSEIPVFWACGVTPQAVAERARVDLMITHEPAQMFVTDLPREG